MLSEEELWQKLHAIPDPEIPTIDIVELGIVRALDLSDSQVVVTITPTYSGCPAMHMIEGQIRESLSAADSRTIVIKTVHAPAWTTDWLTPEAKEKLRVGKIAPPAHAAGEFVAIGKRRIECPYCRSLKTELQSEFGSTACKALYLCKECQQPFDYFKPF